MASDEQEPLLNCSNGMMMMIEMHERAKTWCLACRLKEKRDPSHSSTLFSVVYLRTYCSYPLIAVMKMTTSRLFEDAMGGIAASKKMSKSARRD